ncbi:nuclear transport factor 2 family protein [Dryocola sp. BD586]|uniref:nuclear transport factor 2 family protein n=1 Tax=Dryocola sp. BD586 TaxID=3133271 RepID=UPI003F508BE0
MFEQLRQSLMINADINALAQLLDEELVHVHSTGMVHNKSQLLEHVQRMGGFIAIQREEPAVQIVGDIAILSGLTRNTVRSLESGLPMVREGFSTLVLRRHAGRWRILLSQLTPLSR